MMIRLTGAVTCFLVCIACAGLVALDIAKSNYVVAFVGLVLLAASATLTQLWLSLS